MSRLVVGDHVAAAVLPSGEAKMIEEMTREELIEVVNILSREVDAQRRQYRSDLDYLEGWR